MSETATCKHCGLPISRLTQDESDAATLELGIVDMAPSWWHTTIDGRLVRTCRAASFDPDRRDALGPAPWDLRWSSKRSPSAEPE